MHNHNNRNHCTATKKIYWVSPKHFQQKFKQKSKVTKTPISEFSLFYPRLQESSPSQWSTLIGMRCGLRKNFFCLINQWTTWVGMHGALSWSKVSSSLNGHIFVYIFQGLLPLADLQCRERQERHVRHARKVQEQNHGHCRCVVCTLTNEPMSY